MRTLYARRMSQRSSAYDSPYGPKLWSRVYGYASTLVLIGARIGMFDARHCQLYCGTMPSKLRRSSSVKSVPDTASVRCADEMRHTRRSVGTYTQVSSFLVPTF